MISKTGGDNYGLPLAGVRSLHLLLLCAEIAIGMFVQDAFVRPYVGDILIIVLLCCLVRIAVPKKPVCLGLYMIFVGAAAELLQLIHLDRLLHAEGTLLGVILGSTFDIMDLFCYAAGGVLFFLAERLFAAIYRCRRGS